MNKKYTDDPKEKEKINKGRIHRNLTQTKLKQRLSRKSTRRGSVNISPSCHPPWLDLNLLNPVTPSSLLSLALTCCLPPPVSLLTPCFGLFLFCFLVVGCCSVPGCRVIGRVSCDNGCRVLLICDCIIARLMRSACISG